MKVPAPFVAFYARFPLVEYPPVPTTKRPISEPTLWVLPPHADSDSLLSADVECLKWQAYIVLRGLSSLRIRIDIVPDGALDGSLPNLHVPMVDSLSKAENPALVTSEGAEDGELLAAHSIPAWVDMKLQVDSTADPLEGYCNQEAKVESRAWISLLEGTIHAALLLFQPSPSLFESLLFPKASPPLSESLQKLLSPPPAPLTGLFSLLPPTGTRLSTENVLSEYRDAISSLSNRLGTDKWFLGSSHPTALDALAFAYIHTLLRSHETLRVQVTRRVNLVAWEYRVGALVRQALKA